MITNHSHSGLGGDGEKISWNNLKDKPTIPTIGGKRGTGSRNATGNYSITGLGFQPKVIYFRAWLAGVNLGWSDGSGDATSYSCRYQYYTGGNINTNSIGNLAYCYDASITAVSACNLVSLDTDGFTINVLNVGAGALEFEWIAY